MKKLIAGLAASLMIMSGNVAAHADHGKISGQVAVEVAAKAAKQMTFKDFGFDVGKLDESWKDVSSTSFAVASMERDYYVVRATHPESGEKVYFKIAGNGMVIDAKEINEF
ncbi:MAG: hypothetical protein CL587_06325 [Alteromonadaceae bacterium]|nr:hypothetical protein [Alteromonadaceae bacterium]